MRFRPVVAALVLASSTLAAHAASFTFSFGVPSGTFSGNGILTTGSPIAPGEYLITSVTGSASTTANGPSLPISSILAPGIFPTPTNGGTFPANDNVLFAFGTVGSLSSNGLSFLLSDGSQFNLYTPGGIGTASDLFVERADGSTGGGAVPLSINALAPTPEPSGIALLGTGLAAFATLVKRRSGSAHQG